MKNRVVVILLCFSALLLSVSCSKTKVCDPCTVNVPPVAAAGLDTVIFWPANSFFADGSRSMDPNGKIKDWNWSKISGPASLTIANPSSPKTSISNLETGVYLFSLKVTDDGGLSAFDTIEVNVIKPGTQPNTAPVARAGRDINLIGTGNTSVYLNGSASSDAENNIVYYRWRLLSGSGSEIIESPTKSQTYVRNVNASENYFELSLFDAGGLSSKDTVLVKLFYPEERCGGNRSSLVAQLTPAGTISVSRAGMAVVAAGNKIFFAGGQSIIDFSGAQAIFRYHTTVDIYDVVTKTWSVSQLSVPRSEIAAVAAGNKVFFAGGFSETATAGKKLFDVVDIYDNNTGSWSVAKLSEARTNITPAVVGNKVLFAGGRGLTNNLSVLSKATVDIYDVTTGLWSVSSLSEAREGMAAVTLQNKVYFSGGNSNDGDYGGSSDRIDVYDHSTGTWSVSALKFPRYGHAGVAVSDKIYWAGGNLIDDWGATCLVEEWNSRSNSTSMNSLSNKISWEYSSGHKAVIYKNRIVFWSPEYYIWGERVTGFDIFDLSSNTWVRGYLSGQQLQISNFIIQLNGELYIGGGFVNGRPDNPDNRVWKLDF